MSIDKEKMIPAGKDDMNEVTAMNVVGIERDGKDELVTAETEKGKQFGEKDIMSSELSQGVTIKAFNNEIKEQGIGLGD